MILVFLSAWAVWQLFLDSYYPNPLTPFITISYPLASLPTDADPQYYGKGPKDICFLLFYVVVFSFTRQAVTEWLLRPFAKFCGIRGHSKTMRFLEQGYAFVYFASFSAANLVSQLFQTKQNSTV